MSDFETVARDALERAGMTVRDGDLDVLQAIAQALDPQMRALDEADLAELPFEGNLDPGRPPIDPTEQ